MSGVKVGIGAIVSGNPARVIRYRFDENTITRLNALAWWNWPVEQISRNLKLITSRDIADLEILIIKIQ